VIDRRKGCTCNALGAFLPSPPDTYTYQGRALTRLQCGFIHSPITGHCCRSSAFYYSSLYPACACQIGWGTHSHRGNLCVVMISGVEKMKLLGREVPVNPTVSGGTMSASFTRQVHILLCTHSVFKLSSSFLNVWATTLVRKGGDRSHVA
jgi:hypothetical protein